MGSLRQGLLALVCAFALCAPFVASASFSIGDYNTGNGAGKMIAYWPLDENSGSVIKDKSGALVTAYLTSPSWTTSSKFGKSALSFTGSPQIASTTLAFPSSAGSVSVWVYPTSYADWISPAGWKLLGTNNGYIIIDEGGSGTPGKWRAVFKANNAGNGEQDIVALQNITQNTWQHLIMTWSLSGSTYTTTFYVNGVYQGSATYVGTLGTSGVGHFHFGNSGDYPDNYFLGRVDDVRVYNYALSASQARALYQTGVPIANLGHANTTTLSTGLVGYWPLDGSTINWTKNQVSDLSGQGNTGTLISMSTTSSPVAGKIGGALKLNGSSSYINVPSNSPLKGSNVTISFWIMLFSLTSGHAAGGATVNEMYPLSYTDGSADDGFEFYIGTSHHISFYANGLSNAAASLTALSVGQWYHVVGTYDGSNVKMYINGVLEKTSAKSGSISYSSVCALTIGHRSSCVGYDAYTSGTIDDVRIYNRALSAQEVALLYASGQVNVGHSAAPTSAGANNAPLSNGLVGYWTFDGPSINWRANTVSDMSGSGNTGTLVSLGTSTAPTAGKIGQALKFNGSSGNVSFATGTNIPVGNSNYTLSAWIKPTSLGGYGGIIGWGNYGTTNQVNAFRLTESGSCTGGQGVYNYWWGNDLKACTTLLTANAWHFVVAEFDGTTRKIYVDNTLIANDTPGSSHSVPNTSNFKVGQTCPVSVCTGNGGEFFPGSLDDVRIYSRALSAQEIQQLYSMGR